MPYPGNCMPTRPSVVATDGGVVVAWDRDGSDDELHADKAKLIIALPSAAVRRRATDGTDDERRKSHNRALCFMRSSRPCTRRPAHRHAAVGAYRSTPRSTPITTHDRLAAIATPPGDCSSSVLASTRPVCESAQLNPSTPRIQSAVGDT